MHLTQAFLVLFAAISISGIAAYVSVTGMMAVFPAEPIIVAVIMTSLEFGKIVAVEWLHSNWKNQLVSNIHRAYMCLAVLALMLVTAIGVYGFFSKGYLEQGQPSKEAALHIAQLETQIQAKEKELINVEGKVSQLDSTIDRALSGRSDLSANRATQIRNQQKGERQLLTDARTEITLDIKKLNEELVPLKMKGLEVEAKLGPVKYLASLLGLEDENSAVQLVILVLMFAFDPFAISLVISASISFRTWSLMKKPKVEEPSEIIPEKEEIFPVVSEPAPIETSPYDGYQYSPKDEPQYFKEEPTDEVENPILTKPVKLKKTRQKKIDKNTPSITQVAGGYLSEQDRDKILPNS